MKAAGEGKKPYAILLMMLLANYIRVGTQFASGKLTGRVPFDIYAAG